MRRQSCTQGSVTCACGRACIGSVLLVVLAGCAHLGSMDRPGEAARPMEPTVAPALDTAMPPLPVLMLGAGTVERAARAGIRIPSAWPIDVRVAQIIDGFGARRIGGSNRYRPHVGIDIKGPMGQSVTATADGVVLMSTYQSGYGNIVVVQHADGVQTAYAHLMKRSVDVGDRISQGEEVGRLGGTGRVTTPHVHYEVRFPDGPVDPIAFLPAIY